MRSLVSEREGGGQIASSEHFRTPDTLREAIRRRLTMLSEPTQSLLNIAAVIGNDFAAETGRKVAAVSREEANSMLDEAAAGGILIALGSDRFRFAHALIRSALYEALDTNRRLGLHRSVGEAIEQLHAQNLAAHLDELAHHYGAAGLTEKAIEYSYRAAKAAYAVYAYALAAKHWRAVDKMTAGQRDERRAGMLFGLGQVEAFQLDPAAGIAHLEQALELYRELKIDERTASINVTLGLAQVFLADFAPQMNVARSLEYFRKGQEWQGTWTDPLIARMAASGHVRRAVSASPDRGSAGLGPPSNGALARAFRSDVDTCRGVCGAASLAQRPPPRIRREAARGNAGSAGDS